MCLGCRHLQGLRQKGRGCLENQLRLRLRLAPSSLARMSLRRTQDPQVRGHLTIFVCIFNNEISGMGLFGGQSTIKRSAGTRPNTPVFGGEAENTGYGDDGEEGYDQEDQDDNYEEDDGSGSQPDVTVVTQKDSQAPFGNIKFSSQGKFTVRIFAFVYISTSLKLQLCSGNPILHQPSPQSFLASVKAPTPH